MPGATRQGCRYVALLFYPSFGLTTCLSVGCAECNEAHHVAIDALRKLSTSYAKFRP